MGWFNKKDTQSNIKLLETVLEALKIADQRLTSLEIAVEGIMVRFKKRLIPSTKEESDGKEPDKLPTDGFDVLRKLNKDHGTQF